MDELVNDVLRESANVHSTCKKRASDATFKMLKRSAGKINKRFAEFVRLSRAREARLTLELHLLKSAVAKELVDRDANRAKVYEILRRRYEKETDALPPLTTHTVEPPLALLCSSSSNAVALDRVVNSVARLESSFIAVAAHEPVHIHGAGLFSAISPECPRV
tara:strand:+ start:1296 stop:1784 length:489 start_codon:yes stop_codon:yes gene_type:complete